MRTLWGESFPDFVDDELGSLTGSIDLLPKPPPESPIPVYATGHSGQSLDWIAQNTDGWMYYPRNAYMLQQNILQWEEALSRAGQPRKPYLQSLYIDLTEDPSAMPVPIHLGYRLGRYALTEHLHNLARAGVNHVIFNLKFAARPVSEVLDELAQDVLKEIK